MVFRAESQSAGVATDGRGDGASDGWASDAALAVVREVMKQRSSEVTKERESAQMISCASIFLRRRTADRET